MNKILFVCHGNICRSPMAEFVMKYLTKNRDDFLIESKATSYEEIGNDIYYLAKKTLDKFNIPYEKRTAKRVETTDYDRYDYIIIMDSLNERNIKKIFLNDKENKIHKLLSFTGTKKDISDPWYSGEFDECYCEIEKGCKALLQFIDNKNDKK